MAVTAQTISATLTYRQLEQLIKQTYEGLARAYREERFDDARKIDSWLIELDMVFHARQAGNTTPHKDQQPNER